MNILKYLLWQKSASFFFDLRRSLNTLWVPRRTEGPKHRGYWTLEGVVLEEGPMSHFWAFLVARLPHPLPAQQGTGFRQTLQVSALLKSVHHTFPWMQAACWLWRGTDILRFPWVFACHLTLCPSTRFTTSWGSTACSSPLPYSDVRGLTYHPALCECGPGISALAI